MKISFRTYSDVGRTETFIRFLTKEERDKTPLESSEGDWFGAPNTLLPTYMPPYLFVGLGDRDKVTAHTVRSAAGAAIMHLKKRGIGSAVFDLNGWQQFVASAIEGALLADYRFEKFKEKKTTAMASLALVVTKSDLAAAKRAGARGAALAEATNYARSIGNEPGNVIFPATLAQEAQKLAKRAKLRVKIFDERALHAGKFGGILAVGKGSANSPRLIVLEHRGGPVSQKPIALVGKAITFDTGGISIKSASGMEEMIFDKSGGMAVLGAMLGLAELGVKRNVVGVIAAAENMPSSAAYRPGDIVTTYDGKHIEIVNTDAEGRVVLADAIAYARKDLRAAAIIDLATLTGACGVALGDYAAGLWATDDDLRNALLSASEKTGERLWPMPLFDEYTDQIKSDIALIKNSGGRLGGACTAAAFLKAFAEETPWAHLDIAHVANITKDRGDFARGATGFGVRTLLELIEQWR